MSSAPNVAEGTPATREAAEKVLSTCSAHVAEACLAESPGHLSTQLCVLGVGLNLDGVAANLIFRAIKSSGPDHVFAVVLPDRVDAGLVGSLAASVAYQLRLLLSREAVPVHVPVHVLKEGTGTKERCQAFLAGGLVVTTSKMLCADLLHRRLAAEVMAVCIACLPAIGVPRATALRFTVGSGHSASLTNLAFCIEILLRGGRRPAGGSADSALVSRPMSPRVVVLSDSPAWVQYLVNRRSTGQERFTALLRVGDVQLFPRFRLSLMEHFEMLARTKPLPVDRSVVSVPASVQILDDLLKKVLLEVVSELHSLERRQSAQADGGEGRLLRHGEGSHLSRGGEDGEDELRRLQPRVRARVEADRGGGRPHVSYDGHPSRASRAAAADEGTALPRRPGRWRHPNDAARIVFANITAEECHETETAELDTDLAAALHANDAAWPYRLLVESLLDVRRLRRALHFGSQFDFVFVLQDVLERRTPRPRHGITGAPPTTTALWTLSPHFSDIVTVATHRIGRVVEQGTTAPSTPATVIDVDTAGEGVGGDGEEDEDVVVRDSRPPPVAARRLSIVPSEEEQDTHLGLAHSLALSWARGERRRLARAATPRALDRSAGEDCSPALLLILFGAREVQSMVRRLRYPREEFERRQLADFLERYQRYYGIHVVRHDAGEGVRAAGAGQGGTHPAGEGETPSVAEVEGEVEAGDFFDAEAILQEQDGEPEGGPGGDRTRPSPRREASLATVDDGGGGLSLLHSLLSQQTPPVVACTAPERVSPRRVEQLTLEYNSCGFAVLALTEAGGPAGAAPPRVVLIDGTTLRPGDLLSLVYGDDPRLQNLVAPPAGVGERSAEATGAPMAGRVAVRRFLVTQQSLPVLRTLEALQDELEPTLLARLRAQLVVTTLSAAEGQGAVARERDAFQSLAHTKGTLTGRMLVDRSAARETAEMLEAGLLSATRPALGRRPSGSTAVALRRPTDGSPREVPRVIFDEREFRSMLPYHLYARGIELVPLTLNTADYVLSPEMAVERKSVPDFFQSIGSGRILEQLTALERRYARPVLLIEFERGRPFRLVAASATCGGPRGAAWAAAVYARLARMLAAHPRVSLVWSRSPAHTAGMVATLKLGVACANADPGDPTLTGGVFAAGGGADDGPGSEAAKAMRHYAMRVLARFPGVRAGNAEAVMRLCGSLAGLSGLSRESLVATMGADDGEALYNFLHAPLSEPLGQQQLQRSAG